MKRFGAWLALSAILITPSVGHASDLVTKLRELSRPAVIQIKGSNCAQHCNSVCRAKCIETAKYGGLTVEQCYEKWGRINNGGTC